MIKEMLNPNSLIEAVFGDRKGHEGEFETLDKITKVLKEKGYSDISKEKVESILNSAVKNGEIKYFMARVGNTIEIVYGWPTRYDIPKLR
jgi:hypothetical protein